MEKVYDLVVIGGGSGGLSAVGFGIETHASVALIEKNRVGGDCTWSGCVPSKSLLKAAKIAHHIRTANQYGVTAQVPEVAIKAVMGRVHNIINETYEEEKPEVLRNRGADVYIGEAQFADPHTLKVGDEIINARNVVIATGAHPFIPPIEGIETVDYLTYESIWHITELPKQLIVLGGGPIGSEMAQAFNRLGSKVCQIEAYGSLLSRDESLAGKIIMDTFLEEGIDLHCNSKASKVWQDDQGIHVLAGEDEIVGDALLVAVGRRPNVDGLDLEKAGIEYSVKGIKVDDYLRTKQPHIYAAGDCLGGYQFTHYAGWQATMAARNALLPGKSKGILHTVPWTTFTDPEVAHVGMTEQAAREIYGDAVKVIKWPLTKVDRARAENDTNGYAILVHKKGRVLGATIIAERAGELIHEWLYVVKGKLKLRDVTTAMHIYPTYSRVNVKSGGALMSELYLDGKMGKLLADASRFMLRIMRLRRGF
jgi:pyruvate/2-oxoglutarate dehydrogenase complex dihydrolipoamide dehydrogenase (E3) component